MRVELQKCKRAANVGLKCIRCKINNRKRHDFYIQKWSFLSPRFFEPKNDQRFALRLIPAIPRFQRRYTVSRIFSLWRAATSVLE